MYYTLSTILKVYKPQRMGSKVLTLEFAYNLVPTCATSPPLLKLVMGLIISLL